MRGHMRETQAALLSIVVGADSYHCLKASMRALVRDGMQARQGSFPDTKSAAGGAE